MADEIERVIYRLEVDGSAYIDGVDKTAAATNKLSQAQDLANKKLIELKSQVASMVKQLNENTGAIIANEKEAVELTKKLNDLKAANKGTSVEAKNLQTQLRGIATSTKEFRIESATLRTNLTATNIALKAHIAEMKAAEAASGGFTKGVTKAYSGLRTLANVIPGLGIGSLIALVAGPLIDAFSNWITSMSEAGDKLDFVSEAIKGTDEASNNLKDALRELGDNAEDVATNAFKNLSDATNKLKEDLGETPNAVQVAQGALVLLENNLDKLTKKYTEFSFASFLGGLPGLELTANSIDKTNALIAEGQKQLTANFIESGKIAELEGREVNRKILEDNIKLSQDANNKIVSNQKNSLDVRRKALADNLSLELQLNRINLSAELLETKDNENKIALAQEKFRFSNIKSQQDFNDKVKALTQKGVTDVANIYEKELLKLKSDIAKLDEKGFTTEESITKAIEADFKIRSDAFLKAFQNKQLTAPQLASLQQNLKNLQDLTLNAQLKSFRETRQAYLQAINDEITSLQLEESTKRIATIQDAFERERQTILLETDKTVSALEQKRDQRIAQILKDAAKNGLTPAELAPQIELIKTEYEKLLNDLQIIKNQKLQQLSFETFEALTEDAKRALDAENLAISEGSLLRIKEQAELFRQGLISFTDYQKALTKIANDEANKRFIKEKQFLESEIKLRDAELFGDENLTEKQQQKLRDEITVLRQRLADAEKGNVTGSVTDPGKGNDQLKKFNDYANAIKDLTDSIISFWQQSNEAEQKALDYSISLQEKRVDAAQVIADRGNAQYLKAEQDRLTELNLQRENAARKQLGIDAALQASQILVGITGAIAKIATPGIGIAETIGSIAVIIGALATGYGLVKSLQGNQPQLYEGTKYLNRNGAPSGRDTIPVMAHEGEAVIPADVNKKYSPAISAIYDGTIPAQDLNQFVNTYHKIKPVPQVDYHRIGEAAMFHVERDGKMSVLLADNNKKLDESNELSKMTLQAMKKMSVSANIDRNGVAIMVNEWVQKSERDKKV